MRLWSKSRAFTNKFQRQTASTTIKIVAATFC
jgi:hypothetical protein